MRILPVLVILTLAFAAGCFTKKADTAGGAGDNVTATPTSSGSMTATAVSVDLVDQQIPPGVGTPPTTMGISPNHLDLKVGQRVNLTVNNKGNVNHDLVIEGLDVKTDSIASGGSMSVEFTPTKAGTYPMYCDLGAAPLDHRSQGMQGDVTVA